MWCNWGVRLKIKLSHHTADFPTTAKLDCRASQISSHQATEHRSTTKKGAAKQTAAAMERQHCTPTPRLQEFKAHHIDGAGLPSAVYRAENHTVPFIGRDFHHQQCSTPGTPRGKEQEHRPPPPQQRTGYPHHHILAASPIPKPDDHLSVKPTARNDCCRTNRVNRAGIGQVNRMAENDSFNTKSCRERRAGEGQSSRHI